MTFGTFLSHCDAGDPLAFLWYYVPSFAAACLAAIVLNAAFLFGPFSKRKFAFWLNLSIGFCWAVYFFATASEYMTQALLGSESSEAAEFAFQNSFKLNLNQAIRLAVKTPGSLTVDDVGEQNVRFYAACRVADLLESSNQDFQYRVLNRVLDAPIVTPGFFGTNSINCIFYIQYREQPRLEVTDIIQRRLAELGKRNR